MLHHLDPLTTRSAFTDAAAVFLATVAAVADDQWEQPGVGEWTVRELTAHTIRSFETLERLCDTAAAVPVVESAAAYYRRGRRVARRAPWRCATSPRGRRRAWWSP